MCGCSPGGVGERGVSVLCIPKRILCALGCKAVLYRVDAAVEHGVGGVASLCVYLGFRPVPMRLQNVQAAIFAKVWACDAASFLHAHGLVAHFNLIINNFTKV